ncbi:DUF3440 domain-containing protein [Enterococcus faecalis]|uniref:DUF3440 domain-containing protein n=1 Tax=Enterococcus faecalis TaxID=1351 RepID=UPI001A95EC7B|nr:DUF3440 domain-containing protein [Enterococcus faecalis]MBO1137582.1 DUF3440 domain-containing protein [Enterococcus faecalis]
MSFPKINVYEASLERIKYIFNHFEQIVVSVSGGKDSGVLLELVNEVYLMSNSKKKVSVFHIDYEGGYTETFKYIDRCKSKFNYFDFYHICLPLSASCGVSMFEPTWLPWDPEKSSLWLKELPSDSINLTNHCFDFFQKGMSDYKFQENFGRWIKNKNKVQSVAILIGLRTQESLNRYISMTRDTTSSMYNRLRFSKKISENIYNFYPIYDWKVDDVWLANYKFKWDYNKVYDAFYKAKVPINCMRIANPFHECGVNYLKLYQIIEPEMWNKMLYRVNGVNFSKIYGKTKLIAHKKVTIPKGHSWKSYTNLLLKTLPSEVRDIYLKKFLSSKRYWLDKGGALPLNVVEELEEKNIKFDNLGKPINKRHYRQEYVLVRFHEYPDFIDSKYFRLLPSYKRMCITILKNDTSCRYMGFGPTKDELRSV